MFKDITLLLISANNWASDPCPWPLTRKVWKERRKERKRKTSILETMFYVLVRGYHYLHRHLHLEYLLVHDVSDLNERTHRENSSGKKRSHCRGLRRGRQHVSNSPSNRNHKPLSYTSYTAKEKEERALALSPTMRTFNSSLVFDGVWRGSTGRRAGREGCWMLEHLPLQ